MIEVVGNLWDSEADVRVITTNGSVKKNGEAVMGRGCALEAKQRWPALAATLGTYITRFGNRVTYFQDYNLFTFPVKHEWMQKADIDLIKLSAEQLSLHALHSWEVILMPRPGCGNGGLQWCSCPEGWVGLPHEDLCKGVKHLIAPILDDRFHVITFAGKAG